MDRGEPQSGRSSEVPTLEKTEKRRPLVLIDRQTKVVRRSYEDVNRKRL